VGALGTAATAAVGSTTTVNWLIVSTIGSMGVGFLAYISQARGAGDYDRARRASSQAVLMMLAIGLLFTALPLALAGAIPAWMQVEPSVRPLASKYFFIIYIPTLFRAASMLAGTLLRAAGDTKSPMAAGILMNVLNVVLNALLIFPSRTVTVLGLTLDLWGAGMGVVGAAVATAVSFAAGGVVLMLVLWKHKEISPKGYSLKPDRAVLLPCLRVAVPAVLQRFATSLGYVVFASMINSLGEISTAAHTVANTVESAFYVPGYGMQTASATLTGECIGAKDRARLRSITTAILVLETGLMVLSGALLFCFAPVMAGLFSRDVRVISLSSTVLRMVALSEPFYGIYIVLEGCLQGAGNTKAPFLFNVIGMWCVRILGTFILVVCLHHGLVAAWGAMICHNLLLCLIFVLYFRSGRWSALTRRA
jgi:putative MATE family efflux protein